MLMLALEGASKGTIRKLMDFSNSFASSGMMEIIGRGCAVSVDSDGHFLLRLKLRHAGELIHVPPSRFFQVTNLVDCVKLGWDVLRPSELTQ